MKRCRLLALLLLVSPSAHAQLPMARLNSIFPCGARQGTAVDCTVAGGDLHGATRLYFSHAGITAETLKPNVFKVTVGSDVPVGHYDVRVVTALGLSNVRAFVVGDWPEATEKEPNNEIAQAQRVPMPAVVSGKMDGGTDVDHYVFAAKKGQRVLINCWAWRLDSQLDGTLRLYDAQGKELGASVDHFGRDPFIDFTAPEDGDYTVRLWDFVYGGGGDYFYRLHIGNLPHLDAMVPAAVNPGTKTTVTFFGRNLPGGKPAPGGAQIQGRPLEVITRDIEVSADVAASLKAGEALRPGQTSLDGMPYRITTPEGSSNHLFLGFTPDPIVLEKEPNNDKSSPQSLTLPCDVTGTFAPAGDQDFYAFTAKKGEKYVVETIGERQLGLIDPVIHVFDPKGKKVSTFDDYNRNIGKIRFTSSSRDAYGEFTAALDGDYVLQVRDSYYQQRGDARFVYRLCVRKQRPDFRLVAVPMAETQPDCTVVRQGGREFMDVLVFRNDGYDEPIRIEATDLPPGVTCDPVVVGPNKTSVPLVFKASADAAIGHADIRIVGKGMIAGKEETCEVRAGGLTWGTTNTPGLARLNHSIVLAVREAPPFALTATPERTSALPGEKISIAVALDRAKNWTEAVQISAYDLPQNTTVALVNLAPNAKEGKAELTLAANVKPGTYTFILTGAGQVPRDYVGIANPQAKNNNQRMRVVMPSNAITVTVMPPTK